MKNAYTGQTEIELGGVKYPLAFTWARIAELRTMYGKAFDQEIIAAISGFDTSVIADVVSVGIGGALTSAQVKELSPALVPVSGAINEALTFAFYGPDIKKKKAPGAKLMTWFMRLFRHQ